MCTPEIERADDEKHDDYDDADDCAVGRFSLSLEICRRQETVLVLIWDTRLRGHASIIGTPYEDEANAKRGQLSLSEPREVSRSIHFRARDDDMRPEADYALNFFS